jgi:hypothetical protein
MSRPTAHGSASGAALAALALVPALAGALAAPAAAAEPSRPTATAQAVAADDEDLLAFLGGEEGDDYEFKEFLASAAAKDKRLQAPAAPRATTGQKPAEVTR